MTVGVQNYVFTFSRCEESSKFLSLSSCLALGVEGSDFCNSSSTYPPTHTNKKEVSIGMIYEVLRTRVFRRKGFWRVPRTIGKQPGLVPKAIGIICCCQLRWFHFINQLTSWYQIRTNFWILIDTKSWDHTLGLNEAALRRRS